MAVATIQITQGAIVGGSGELLKNVYGRFRAAPVTFLVPGLAGQTDGTEDGLRVVRGSARPAVIACQRSKRSRPFFR